MDIIENSIWWDTFAIKHKATHGDTPNFWEKEAHRKILGAIQIITGLGVIFTITIPQIKKAISSYRDPKSRFFCPQRGYNRFSIYRGILASLLPVIITFPFNCWIFRRKFPKDLDHQKKQIDRIQKELQDSLENGSLSKTDFFCYVKQHYKQQLNDLELNTLEEQLDFISFLGQIFDFSTQVFNDSLEQYFFQKNFSDFSDEEKEIFWKKWKVQAFDKKAWQDHLQQDPLFSTKKPLKVIHAKDPNLFSQGLVDPQKIKEQFLQETKDIPFLKFLDYSWGLEMGVIHYTNKQIQEKVYNYLETLSLKALIECLQKEPEDLVKKTADWTIHECLEHQGVDKENLLQQIATKIQKAQRKITKKAKECATTLLSSFQDHDTFFSILLSPQSPTNRYVPRVIVNHCQKAITKLLPSVNLAAFASNASFHHTKTALREAVHLKKEKTVSFTADDDFDIPEKKSTIKELLQYFNQSLNLALIDHYLHIQEKYFDRLSHAPTSPEEFSKALLSGGLEKGLLVSVSSSLCNSQQSQWIKTLQEVIEDRLSTFEETIEPITSKLEKEIKDLISSFRATL